MGDNSNHLLLNPEAVTYLINHVFLPPQVPQSDDFNPILESIIIKVVTASLQKLLHSSNLSQQVAIASAITMITSLSEVHDPATRSISENKLRDALVNLCRQGGTVPLQLRAQNCGLLISKVDNSIQFETFELSPLNSAVIITKGRLQRSFPGPAFSVELDTFGQESFLTTVAHTLAKMSHQTALGTMPQVLKAGRMHDEDRDTTHPKMVTELFMGFLRAVGKPASVSRIWKNTRDEVMFQSSHRPWRRSSLWLLVRVTMQLHFSRSEIHTWSGRDGYKTFMLVLTSYILEHSQKSSISNDLIYAMTAKISRRLLKFNSPIDGRILNLVQYTVQNANKFLHARWSDVMNRDGQAFDLSVLKSLDFPLDTRITLPKLDEYLKLVTQRKNSTISVTFRPTSENTVFLATELPSCLESRNGDYVPYKLKAFEAWVDANLTLWIESHKEDPSTCAKLAKLIRNYYGMANSTYSGNVEATSIMILTILELWIACDESATKICETLKHYGVGIDRFNFQGLVLPFKSQMERLFRAENYLSRRVVTTHLRNPHIFCSFGKEDSFSVKYFDQSTQHQDLLKDIQRQAMEDKNQKLREFSQKQEQYKKFMLLYDQNDCEFDEVVVDIINDFREKRHRTNCKKCKYKTQAAGLNIKIHEWPLPKNTLEAKSVVFELQAPSFFGHWRDVTLYFKLDVLKYDYKTSQTPSFKYPLKTYMRLSSFFTPFSSTQRIGLLSETKPHEVTHRRDKQIAVATEDDICLDTGLLYKSYDDQRGCFVDGLLPTARVARMCMYKLPARSSSLQEFLFRPTPTLDGPKPNTVIASQSMCPAHMSFDEFKALGTIPQLRLQWQNILLQLSVPTVDFKTDETGLVVLQAIHQTGPSKDGNVLRIGHEILNDESFAHALLAALYEALSRTKENWESSNALSIFISLASRLLSLTSSEHIKDRSLAYLADVRHVSFHWVNLLRERTQQSINDSQRRDLGSKAVELALICVDSFNLEDKYMKDTLIDPETASVFIQCSIVIQEGDLSTSKATNTLISILYHRWKGNAYRCYLILEKELLHSKAPSLDNAIKKSWSAYQSGHGWQVYGKNAEYWLVSKTASGLDGAGNPLSVHFNLLTFELLVNGVPLARLPSVYESHSMYRILFGYSAVEVMPTAVPGLRYSGKKEFYGYTIHFGFNTVAGISENDLLVQATKDDRQYELLPRRVFRGHFPVAFVEDFIHWYDSTNDSVEFRPIEDPWATSSNKFKNYWRLSRASDGRKWHLNRDGLSLIGFTSDTATRLSSILAPLENSPHIHIILHQSSLTLEIELPRIQLGFNLSSNSSTIQSRQFRGMSIDSSQSLGTLIGFRNKLILKHEHNDSRLIVLLEGNVYCKSNGNHVHVSIDIESAKRTHAFQVDDLIGRLIDNGSLHSKLLLAYLHALTSFCLPDPLLQRTGTELALSILRSAAVRSFDRLTEENVQILTQLAQLTPSRCYYPANERVMQTVKWSSSLDFLAQHGSFYKYVKSIFDQAAATSFFHPDVKLPELHHVQSDLLERESMRSSTFRVSGFGAEEHNVKHDAIYTARDRDQNSRQGLNAFLMSRLIYENRTTLHSDLQPDFINNLWGYLKRSPQILGPKHPLPLSEVKYDGRLLSSSSAFISRHWIGLHRTLSTGSNEIKPQLMIWLSTLAFAPEADMQIIQTLSSFCTVSAMAHVRHPMVDSFRLHCGFKVNKAELRTTVQSSVLPLARSPEAIFTALADESSFEFKKRQQKQFLEKQNHALDKWTEALEAQWPCEVPSTPIDNKSAQFSSYIDITNAMKDCKALFKAWFENDQFLQYIRRINTTLEQQQVSPLYIPQYSFITPAYSLRSRQGFISIDDLFDCSFPFVPIFRPENAPDLLSPITGSSETTSRLSTLLCVFEARSRSNFERNYAKDLRDSQLSLRNCGPGYNLLSNEEEIKEILSEHLETCKDHAKKVYEAIISAFTSPTQSNASAVWAQGFPTIAATARQWPRLSPVFLLQQLARGRWEKISQGWKGCIVHYAVALSDLQRAERLMKLSGKKTDIIKELQNPGHTNWSPLFYPESLLLEVESGIMIREVQEHIAAKMRDPPSGENAVMQLNMGEGKSSVIVPIVAAALANNLRLVRVIVAKPQSKQMLEMLVSKLGGLLDRRVYHMPFSRALQLDEAKANAIGNLYKECMITGGVLLVQPEHILSFKLMCLECLVLGKGSVGNSLLRTQHFFDTSSRDIVDESDENFSPKFELIYTMGSQQPIEFSPERWTCIQQVLAFVKKFALSAKDEFPNAIDIYEAWPGSFPRIRFLRLEAERFILSKIAQHICGTGLEGFPISRQPESVRQAVFKYITKLNPTPKEISQVEKQVQGGFWAATTSSTLLLLRGLLAGGILAFAFNSKRWKVNYGLDTTRKPSTKLAVPYRAKDNPTPRSEFSHPDVVIVFTCLSYYYGGLTNDELFLAFNHLLRSDQADIEYHAWVEDAVELEEAFQLLIGINLKDRVQCEQKVFPSLRHAKGAIDYFLAHIVFPKEMKEFPHKLSTSGWDVGATKPFPTTGFSGTIDSRKLLPLSVSHVDLQEQKHTNALVLENLLDNRNSVALMPPREKTSSSDAQLLLAMVTEMEIQVILDVGAQILELSNRDIAKEWLEMTSEIKEKQAVVFFNDDDELSVLDRKGNIEPLQTSSFAKQLDLCLVFLDEAHTRGTDLKLPEYYRAAVTLGPNLTKDRLVQACMRMRKLGEGQSVVFYVPEEIKNKILEREVKADHVGIDVSDVISWAISETCIDIRRSMPLWAVQGQRFEDQSKLWTEARTDNGFIMSKAQAERFLEDEARGLEARYRPSSNTDVTSIMRLGETKEKDAIIERCWEFDDLKFNSATLQEEQERELSPEIQQERQVQKIGYAKPADHGLHSDVLNFVSSGVILSDSKGYKPAFEALRETSAAKHLEVSQFPRSLLVTEDFARTIQKSGTSSLLDSYQRSVQWVLTSVGATTNTTTVKHMMVISPYEAQELLPEIKKSKIVALHLYSPRPNLSFRALDDLDLYTTPAQANRRVIPRVLVVLLNLFAGQLYLGSYKEYVEVCQLLGLAWKATEEGCIVAADGFIVQRGDGSPESTFENSPVKFLRVLLTKIRRNCEGIEKTHMGKVLDGRLLLPSDFGEDDDTSDGLVGGLSQLQLSNDV